MGQMIVYVGHPGKRKWKTNLRNNWLQIRLRAQTYLQTLSYRTSVPFSASTQVIYLLMSVTNSIQQ